MNNKYLRSPISLQQGFTLIELLIVVAIIGILTAIAVPSYQQHVLGAQRKAVQAKMMEIAGILDNHNSQKGAYFSDFMGALNTNSAYSRSPNKESPHYQIEIIAIDNDGVEQIIHDNSEVEPYQRYIIQALPVATSQQASDPCGKLTLNNFYIKGGDSHNCW